MDSAAPLVVLPRVLVGLLAPLRALTARGMPPVAVIGGVGVTIRLATVEPGHRATADIDVVADDHGTAAIEVLARDHQRVRDQTVVVAGMEVDLIPTQAVSDQAVRAIEDDGSRLFVAAHRWALDTAAGVRVSISGAEAGGDFVLVPVASPAGLVAAKAHAAGFGRPARRAGKRGGDLYDIYRLLEVFDAQGAVRRDLGCAPADTSRLVARVIEVEMLSNPARTLGQMAPSSSQPLLVDRIVDVLEPVVDELAR